MCIYIYISIIYRKFNTQANMLHLISKQIIKKQETHSQRERNKHTYNHIRIINILILLYKITKTTYYYVTLI